MNAAQKPEDKTGGEVKRDTKKMIGARKEKVVSPIPDSKLLEKPLSEGLGALARYNKELGEHLQSNAEKVAMIDRDVRYLEDEELPKMRRSIDEVTGAEKADREKIERITGKLAGIEKDIEKLRGEIEAAKKDIAQKVDNGVEAIKSAASELATKVNDQISKFDERLVGFDKRIHEAEKSAYTAETIVGGLKSIVIEQHQPMLLEMSDDVGGLAREICDVRTSITPRPAEGAKEAVEGIDATPPAKVEVGQHKSIPPGESNDLTVVLEKNSVMSKELEGKTDELRAEIAEAYKDLEIEYTEFSGQTAQIDLSVYNGFAGLGLAHQKYARYICGKIKILRDRDALLENLYDSVNMLLEKEGLLLMKAPAEPEDIALETPQPLDNKNVEAVNLASAHGISAEHERQDKKISMIKAGLGEIYKKYGVE